MPVARSSACQTSGSNLQQRLCAFALARRRPGSGECRRCASSRRLAAPVAHQRDGGDRDVAQRGNLLVGEVFDLDRADDDAASSARARLLRRFLAKYWPVTPRVTCGKATDRVFSMVSSPSMISTSRRPGFALWAVARLGLAAGRSLRRGKEKLPGCANSLGGLGLPHLGLGRDRDRDLDVMQIEPAGREQIADRVEARKGARPIVVGFQSDM